MGEGGAVDRLDLGEIRLRSSIDVVLPAGSPVGESRDGRVAAPASLRQHLRQSTSARHDQVDGLFGSLDLAQRADYGTFLTAHYCAFRAIEPSLSMFCSAELGMAAPLFARDLALDLAALGIRVADLPALTVDSTVAPAGIAYVVAGSRLGLGVLRARGLWAGAATTANRYFSDASGPALWRAMVAWMDRQDLPADELARLTAAADATFALFVTAFHAASPVEAHAA